MVQFFHTSGLRKQRFIIINVICRYLVDVSWSAYGSGGHGVPTSSPTSGADFSTVVEWSITHIATCPPDNLPSIVTLVEVSDHREVAGTFERWDKHARASSVRRRPSAVSKDSPRHTCAPKEKNVEM